MARDAEVFKQHIARENIGRGKLANRVTVFFYSIAQRLTLGLLQPDVQRHHAALDVKMANHDFVAKIGDFPRCFLEQKRHQRRVDLLLIQHKVFEFLSIRHTSDTVMLFDQLIAGADVRGGHLFLRREPVFNDLKYAVEPRKRKHQHHHAANARRFDKLFICGGDITQVFPIAFRFSVLLTANRHIQLGGGFARQDLPQPFHQRGRQRCVHHEIGAGEAKYNAGLGAGGQAGIDKQFPVICAMDGEQKRYDGRWRDQFSYQPGGFIAVKKLVGDLQVAAAE